MSASPAAFGRSRVVSSNAVFKSGHLLISSKGLGWTFWKKRWFILTRTSLVFFKNDPIALPQRGGEVNLTLGGIDLNNLGSVVVRDDKKLLTVFFPDGRDGRAFTLKAETTKDLYEWKIALEHALAQAPSAAVEMGHNGIFRTDSNETMDRFLPQWRGKRAVKSLVVGRPILLALEDIDGGPSFLEKALRFIEKHGVKVEGILRQSADVEEVERRVQEYERGRNEFNPDEDAHLIGDCVKHVLRELPSSPVPASCCIALLEAYRIDQKEARVNTLHSAIQETFPEPNRRLLQRVLKMMHAVCSHASDNRMNSSAVSACMAPLLLRPLVAGECELEDDYDDTNGGNSAQLLAAASAANNAQAIVKLLLEEYENIFYDGGMPRCSLSAHSQTSEHRSDDVKVNGYDDAENEVDIDGDRRFSGKLSESSASAANDLYDYKAIWSNDSDDGSHSNARKLATVIVESECQPLIDDRSSPHEPQKRLSEGTSGKKTARWGTRNTRKKPSTESIDFSGEEELAIQRLEIAKKDLCQRVAKEAGGRAILQASLERRKKALHERRLALERDVARLREQLRNESELRTALEVGLNMCSGQFSASLGLDSKTKAELEEIALAEADVARLKQKVAELHHQLNRQHYGLSDSTDGYQHAQGRNSQQKYGQQDFDSTLCKHERKQRTEEVLGLDPRNIEGQSSTSGKHSRQASCNQFLGSTNLIDAYEASSNVPIECLGELSTSIMAKAVEYPQHPSTLAELTTRLDFFKGRRSQLMEQLHNMDSNYGSSTPDYCLYKMYSPGH